jgi:hypothetical protein
LRSESSSEIGTIAPAALAIFKSDDRADERIAPSLDVCDVSIAKLAVTKRLADGGHVDPEAPFLNGYVRPDVIHQLLLRDDLTWAVGKIGQNIQRPIPKGKQSTVAPEHPLANRKFKRAESQLPVNDGAIHVCQPNVGLRSFHNHHQRLGCVHSKSATIIKAARHHNGVSRLSVTGRLRAQLGKVEQDRDQDDREHVATCKGDAGRDENGLQTGQYCEKL